MSIVRPTLPELLQSGLAIGRIPWQRESDEFMPPGPEGEGYRGQDYVTYREVAALLEMLRGQLETHLEMHKENEERTATVRQWRVTTLVALCSPVVSLVVALLVR